MKMLVVVVVVLGIVVPGRVARAQSGGGQDPSAGLAGQYIDPGGGLSLDRAVAQALGEEPALQGARREVDVARGLRVQAGLRPNPTVSFSHQAEPAGMDKQTRLEVLWPLDLFRKAGRVEVADRQLDTARHVLADRERLLADDVRTKYGAVVIALRELSVLDGLFDTVSRQQALIAARVEEGAAPPLERDVLHVELQRLESERLLQAGMVERAMIELTRALGMPAGAPLKVNSTLEELVLRAAPPPGPAADVAIAGERPDVGAAQAHVEVAGAQVERARREGRVDVSLFGAYMRMDSGFPQRGVGAAGGLEPIRGLFHNVAAGASLTVPLFDRRQGEIAAATAERAAASARLEAARLTALAEIAAARTRDDHARRAVAVYTSGASSLARQNLAVVAETYALGRATVFDVLGEQRRYLEVERAFTRALGEAYQARQALRLAMGEMQ
jgi:cobalt-zinc-cadmium efflux system outer membrane protein